MAAQIPSENWRYHLRRGITDLWFLLSISLAILLFLVLLGYHNTDPGWSTSGAEGVTRHWFGHLGAYLSDALLSLTGYAAYILPVGLIIIGIQSARRMYIDAELIAWKFFALFFALLALTGIFSLRWAANINSLAVTAGGVIGQKLNLELLKIWSVPVVMTVFTFLFLVGMTLLMEIPWLKFFEKIGVGLFKAYRLLRPEKTDGITDRNPNPIRDPQEAAKRRRDLADRLSTDIHDQRATFFPSDEEPRARPQPSFNLTPAPVATTAPTFAPVPEPAPAPVPEITETAPPPPPPPAENPAPSPAPTESVRPAEPERREPPILSWNNYKSNHQNPSAPDNPPAASNFPPAALTEAPLFPAAEPAPVAPPAPPPANHFPLRHAVPANDDYPLPPLDLLNPGIAPIADYSAQELDEMAMRLENALKNYKLNVRVENIAVGPVVTRFELSLAPGVKVSSIHNVERDIARSLTVPSVRIVDVIAGKPFVGLEIPNRKREIVPLRSVLESGIFQRAASPLTVALGVDVGGKPITTNLGDMPHLLVAGTTGSGKSVGLNVMLASMLFKARPDDVKLILIDPKMLEMATYADIPHLLTPVITDMSLAENALCWAVSEMERRYQLLAAARVRKIDEFNQMVSAAEKRGEKIAHPFYRPAGDAPRYLEKMPYLVIVIDELAELMMVAGKTIDQVIARIAQKARAAGIHLILATQRPSVDVITGLIKSNIATRIAFQVSSRVDSRIILDTQGAETLLGYGDMLYSNSKDIMRVHGAFIDNQEINRLTDYLRAQGAPQYESAITNPVELTAAAFNATGALDLHG